MAGLPEIKEEVGGLDVPSAAVGGDVGSGVGTPMGEADKQLGSAGKGNVGGGGGKKKKGKGKK
jgi:hypothetical protein